MQGDKEVQNEVRTKWKRGGKRKVNDWKGGLCRSSHTHACTHTHKLQNNWCVSLASHTDQRPGTSAVAILKPVFIHDRQEQCFQQNVCVSCDVDTNLNIAEPDNTQKYSSYELFLTQIEKQKTTEGFGSCDVITGLF